MASAEENCVSSTLFIEEITAKPVHMRALAFAAGFFFCFRLVFTFLGVQLMDSIPALEPPSP